MENNSNPNNNQNNFKIINLDEFDSSNFKTKKKTFDPEINPHIIKRNIQKVQYIWLGVYDQLLRNKHIIQAIKKCKDTSLPLVKNK